MGSSRHTLLRFFDPVFKTPWLSLGSFLIAGFRATAHLVGPYLISQLIVGVELKNHEMFMSYLIKYCILAFFIRLINFFISRILRRYHFDEMRTNIYKDELYTYSLLSNNEAEKIGTGKANSIIQKGADKWIEMINSFFVDFLQSFFIVGGIFVWVYIQIGRRGFMAFSLVRGVSIVISIYGNKLLKKLRAERKEFVTQADKRIIRYVMSKFEMLLSNKIRSELTIVDEIFAQMKAFGKKISFRQVFAVDVVFMTTVIIMSYWLRYAGNAIIAGTMLFGEFTLWRMLFGRMRGNIEQTIFALTTWYDNRTHVEKLREFHDIPAKITGYESGEIFNYKKGNIHIKNITYAYHESPDQGGEHIFKNFSLDLEGQQKTALVGESGSGKSTLVKLIAGYLRPTKGTIIVDDQDLLDVSLKSYYKHIGYLTQEPSVFDGTVYENLTYAIEKSPPEELLNKVIQLAKCEFIYQFPNGLQTEIGERGVRLSGGQRQRLAIAKIFLKNPQIVILDEPTSALDSFSEEAITEAMHNLFKNRTVIIIAHRLQTVKHADDIIVIEEGNVIERGKHDELVKAGGSYAKMLELQSGF